jgi:hypothetical protein
VIPQDEKQANVIKHLAQTNEVKHLESCFIFSSPKVAPSLFLTCTGSPKSALANSSLAFGFLFTEYLLAWQIASRETIE